MPAPKGNKYALGNKGGRPTKYSEEVLDLMYEYLSEYAKGNLEEVIPSIEGFAAYSGIPRSTIYDWKGQDDKKEFTYILSDILSIQARDALNKGLTGDWNSQIVKLLLAKHGYSDKQETDVTTKGEKLETGNNVDVDKLTKEYEQKVKEEIKNQLKNESS